MRVLGARGRRGERGRVGVRAEVREEGGGRKWREKGDRVW